MKKPDFYEEPNHQHNLIIEICRKVRGIGKTTATCIAGYLDTIDAFMHGAEDELLRIGNIRGGALLKAEQATEIIEIRKKYLPEGVTDIKQLWITYLVRKFVWNAIEEIQATDFDELLINPFLICAFNFTDHEGVVTFCFYQKVTRSIVTSWGFTVEQMLLVSGGTPIIGEKAGFDLRVNREGTEYYIQIKSGPNTMDFDQVQNLNNNLAKLQEYDGRIGILGVTYGKDEQLSSIMQRVHGYPESVLIGRNLWDFIAEEKGYTERVLEWASVGLPENINFSTLLEDKRSALIKAWEEKYGVGVESIRKVLQQYL